MTINTYFYNTNIGTLVLKENQNYITNIYIDNKFHQKESLYESKSIKYAYKQIDKYLNKTRKTFDFPIKINGTDFQKQVWKELMNIPYGESTNYKNIAINIGNPNAYRAVGSANSKNPLLLVIPCHRVINKNMQIGGYSSGINIKKKLLDLENIDYKL